ncbi:probable e3 ubiquitin-protein ligase hectd2-like [Lichtheimia corymbifera JMRC:FSU:9682]|uniref:HECT-type E3 ubiquitin transferase n=1 Tax=Lichtheimia corymbifera JMRC:FSU:9682 TaxID=1263082 RepID=A0A068S5Q5_9FUNG|nr:probable e3 ubiquitin-protein ligase hectd2-like [Lichtheimia corymbifera JMRC:FSU:9682]
MPSIIDKGNSSQLSRQKEHDNNDLKEDPSSLRSPTDKPSDPCLDSEQSPPPPPRRRSSNLRISNPSTTTKISKPDPKLGSTVNQCSSNRHYPYHARQQQPTSRLPPPSTPTLFASHSLDQPKSTRRSMDKSQRKRQLKEAKSDYEARIEQYFQQLTIGCGRSDCINRFCASGRGGIRNLHTQAALVMSIQLASRPEDRFCTNEMRASSNSTSSSVIQKALADDEEDDESDDFGEHKSKPFLQSLFSSSAFLSLFGLQREQKDVSSKNRRRKPKRTPSSSSSTQEYSRGRRRSSDSSNVGSWRGGIQSLSGTNNVNQHHPSCIEDDDSSYYYQLDSSDHSRASDSYESDTSDEGMLLAIRPTAITMPSALEQLHRFVDKYNMEKTVHWCRSIFQNWEGIGNSMLLATPQPVSALQRTIRITNLHDLYQFYEAIIGNDDVQPSRLANAVTESFETLLDRMHMNTDNITTLHSVDEIETSCIDTIVQWCRALMSILEWIRLWQSSDFATDSTNMWSDILSHKLIQVVSKIASSQQSLIRKALLQMFACLDSERMEALVQYLHGYLIDHFHTGPYKHGEQDSVIMATKFLQLAYEANVSAAPIIPVSNFCSEAICKKLNIKDEYRIWKRVLQYGEGRHSISTIAAASRPSASQNYGLNEQQRRTRLFLTTTWTSILLPYPFANEYQFSWFSYPFLLPPSVKRKILQLDAMSQMSAEYEDACVNHTLVVHARRLLSDAPGMVRHLEDNLKSATCPYLLLEIRRQHFVTDALHQVSAKWVDLKKPLKVRFIGGGEEGMDQGGVQKEFFGILFEKLTSKKMGLFNVDPETRLCWIQPIPVQEDDLRIYEMVGVMMGLAIYNGVIMNLQFPSILWKVLVQPSEAALDAMAEEHQLFTLNDLMEGWPSLANGLQQLLDWEDQVQDVFCRNYEISIEVFGQGVVTIPLMENGSQVPVTNANRDAFVRDYCTYFLYHAQRSQLLAIRRGVWSVIGGSAMDLCTAGVLEVVACGERQGMDLDLKELQDVADYDDGYNPDHLVIRWFWSIVHNDMTSEQRRKLLFFVTASDRVPVGGLKELTFVVQRNGPDSDRLPTALTCFSRLLLPEYDSREKLRERLITAIENAKGFGLV